MSDYQEVERLYKNVFEKKKDFESALHKYLDEIELYLQCYYRDDCLYDIFDEIYWLETIIENASERVNCNLGKPKQHELLPCACGNTGVRIRAEQIECVTPYYVYCPWCDRIGPFEYRHRFGLHRTEEEAVNSWNENIENLKGANNAQLV